MITINTYPTPVVNVSVLKPEVIDTTPTTNDISVGIQDTIIVLPSIGDAEYFEGPYEVSPKTKDEQTLSTAKKLMNQDVVVHKIPYFKVSNSEGQTVYIGDEV